MVDADLGATQAAEIFLGPIRGCAVKAVSLLMVDPLNFKPFVQMIPCAGFIGVNRGALAMRARMNEAARLSELNTAGTELPSRSRTITTTLRLPL
jgi:hypothetical protein